MYVLFLISRCWMENNSFYIICHGLTFIPLHFRCSLPVFHWILFINSTSSQSAITCDIRTFFWGTTCYSIDVFRMFYLCFAVLEWVMVLVALQGRKFDIRADGLHKKKMVFYSLSVLHAMNLLQHIRNSHRLHLNAKPLVMQLKEKNGQSKRTTKLWCSIKD